MSDVNGLLVQGREDLVNHKDWYAKKMEPIKKLEDMVPAIKPSVMIGATAFAGLFKPELLRLMADINERPVIFALSNPTSKAESTAQEAFDNTDGRVIFSSGSPFPTVTAQGRTFQPGQGNNAYIFPGVTLGVLTTGSNHIPDEMFLIAAQELANFVKDSDLEMGSLYPPLSAVREVSLLIAVAITNLAYEKGYATIFPEPTDKSKWLQEQLYNFNYESSMPITWPWPKMPYSKTRPLQPADVMTKKKSA